MEKRQLTRFVRFLIAGFAAILLLLAGGMGFTIRRLNTNAREQLSRIKRHELEITTAERLRWDGEVLVSRGRGYLISGDRDILDKLYAAEATFDQDVAVLKEVARGGESTALIGDVVRDAEAFRLAQHVLFFVRVRPRNLDEVNHWFHEAAPLRNALDESLKRLVDHHAAVLEQAYDQVDVQRRQLAARMYQLLGLLVVVGLGIIVYFSRLLARGYRQEARALETARQALVARDELMGIVAHDLRNPLGAITMKAELLPRINDPEKIRRQAESIGNVARRMESLVKTMLDVATIEAGHFSVTLAPCDVDQLLHETLDVFTSLSAQKEVRLLVSKHPPGLAVQADRERVAELFSNLLGNALKFTPPGGEVRISVEHQPGAVRFAISDTGPGIAPADARHVFDRFWKRESGGTKGTGLGLFIAKGIVNAHRGRIWVESQPGRGATFCFTLPGAEPAFPPSTRPEKNGPRARA